MSMFDWIGEISNKSAPFLMAANTVPQRLDGKRVMEQLITGVVVALIVGLGGYLFAMPVLTNEMQLLREQVRELRLESKEERLANGAALQRMAEKVHKLELDAARHHNSYGAK